MNVAGSDQGSCNDASGAQPAVTSAEEGSLTNKTYDFDHVVQMVKSGQSLETAVRMLLDSMTRSERLALLDGDEPFWQGLRGILFDRYNRAPFIMGAIPRLKIPGVRFTDGPRGIVMNTSTCFPVSMARGATWDIALEQRIGDAIGVEGRAQGANFFAGICINLPRHPGWGRIQETYGEDPILLGEFGLALHRGVRKHLMTCVKHFALNSMENARFNVEVQIDDTALHEVYLPHFRQLVEDGVSSVMSSYNSVRGEFAGENHELLNEILRSEWGFDGFVVSDFIFGLRDPVKSVKNGLDIEAPFRQQRALHVPQALECGDLEWSDIDRSCTRILRKQIEHTARTGRNTPDSSVVFCDQHKDLAREAAARGMVLLKNDSVSGHPLLPLDPAKLQKVAIIGRLANKPNTGDKGSSNVFPPKVVTLYEGIRAALPHANIILGDADIVGQAQQIAAWADIVLCVVGYDAADEGEYVVPSFRDQKELLDLLPPAWNDEDAEVRTALEGQQSTGFGSGSTGTDGLIPGAGGDRRSLSLRARDLEIIQAVSAVSSRVIVSVVAAGAVIMKDWIDKVPALLMVWYSGGEGGHAFADVLLGKVDASGRMPFSIPKSEAHLPEFDIDASIITYDRWFGQRLLDKLGVAAQFPLGYGLSYTTFALEDLTVDVGPLDRDLDQLTIRTRVVNTGLRPGRQVVQVYGTLTVPDFPTRVLLGFHSIELGPSLSKLINVTCSVRPLKCRHEKSFEFVADTVDIEVGAYAGDEGCLRASIPLQRGKCGRAIAI
ncbi:beta-glucosidase-related glycosidase [Pyrenochaeta sp. DS3sAY3a]|nr:beta-glucosidase-related glycosidase [Pyrenochaeta sp. DS3sAY3a]